jgi:hypothetical protein
MLTIHWFRFVLLQCLLGGPSPRVVLAPPELSQAAQQAASSALRDDSFPASNAGRGEDAAPPTAHREKFLALLMPMVHSGRRFRSDAPAILAV